MVVPGKTLMIRINLVMRKSCVEHTVILYSSLNYSNADSVPMNEHTRCVVDGGLLETNDPKAGFPTLKEAFAAGLSIEVQPLNENVDLYGDTADTPATKELRLHYLKAPQ